ncbi:MAG: cobyric acid synthase [Candidatus Methylomirabilales bacterium]|nr:cobyric acid synthase [candidate division NC10 bacterium]
MSAKSLMVQGTASDVGKSILVAALCRILAQDGYRVAPFKAQNMALNSFVTPEGGEIGRAQAVQAQAARVVPSVLMNPILLKPTNETDAQVIVLGRPTGTFSAVAYGAEQIPALRRVVREAYERLAAEYEVVLIEGAGSPAEVNLRDRDVVNMAVADMADAPVLLVGDIDKGGVFAALVGTLELLEPVERDRVAGFVINKFRGDLTLLAPGLDFVEARTGKRVFGVVPFCRDIRLPEEDALPEHFTPGTAQENGRGLRIGVVALPHLSNFTDFDPLAAEPDVQLSYIRSPDEMAALDCLILPGSKSTAEDLTFLRDRGLADAIKRAAANGKVVVGICGGYQMLGTRIADPDHVESERNQVEGLGLLQVTTRFRREKITHQVRARCQWNECEVTGYEIHHGLSFPVDGAETAFEIVERSGQAVRIQDGAHDGSGRVWGSNIHGLFENASFRHRFLQELWETRGGSRPVSNPQGWDLEREYDRLADLVRAHLDMAAIYRLIEGKR